MGDITSKLNENDLIWYEIRKWIKQKFGLRPDINAMLFLIGINELGNLKQEFSKEEKQDLMHIAMCRLLEPEGYFRLLGNDEEGWPHYEAVKPVPKSSLKDQESLLKSKIITYFDNEMSAWK